ncbi:hypothetical protein FO519_006493 [Halicephalobus sp. NKZ332]|nr:hypothetical protein FO519_006493 [Halicephalobus sp. NKZ332]
MDTHDFSAIKFILSPTTFIHEIEEEDVNFKIWVIIILSAVSVIGLLTNFGNIYMTVKSPVLHNAFGYLCASHSLAEVLNLLIAGIWTIIVAVVDKNLANTILSNKLGQVAVGVCLLTSYTVLTKAINRFMAFATPLVYRNVFNNKNSKFVIGVTWFLGFCHGVVGFFDGCNFILDPIGHFWYFDTTPCGQFLAVYIDLGWSCFIMVIVVILDSITLYNLIRFQEALRAVTGSEANKRSLDIRFFVQSCMTTLLQVLMLISFHVFSRFAESAWAVFFTTTFAWAASSAIDGVVNFGFNLKHLKIKSNPGTDVIIMQRSKIASNSIMKSGSMASVPISK